MQISILVSAQKLLVALKIIAVIIVIVIIEILKRHERFKPVRRPSNLAMSLLTPAKHILAVIREQLTESLLDEGHHEECRTQADALARGLWMYATLDVVFAEARFVLPRERFLRVLSFTQREYSLVFASLPAELRSAAYSEHEA